MDQDKNSELERILAELNSNIKKERDTAKAIEVKAEESVDAGPAAPVPKKAETPKKTEKPEKPAPAPKPEPPKESKPASKQEKEPEQEPPKRKPAVRRKKPDPARGLGEKLEQTAGAATEFVEEEKRSFVETARIIEEDVGDRQERTTPVKHIAVTAVVEVDDAESGEPPAPGSHASSGQGGRTEQADAVPVSRRRGRRPKMTKRERTTAILGIVMTFFVIIGVVSSVIFVVNFTREIVNSTARKEEFAQAIFPLVIVDVPEFDNPTSLDNSAIISSAIWAFVVDDNDKSKYQKDDLGSIYVPDVDVEYYIRKLYGGDVPIKHQSIEDGSIQMIYDSEKKAYIIESTPKYLPYTPRVDKIVREGDLYTLTVSYILPDAMWNMNRGDRALTVDKIMQYKLKKVEDDYQILSVKLLEVTGVTSSDTTGGQGIDMIPIEDEIMSDEPESIPEENPSSAESGAEPGEDASSVPDADPSSTEE